MNRWIIAGPLAAITFIVALVLFYQIARDDALVELGSESKGTAVELDLQ